MQLIPIIFQWLEAGIWLSNFVIRSKGAQVTSKNLFDVYFIGYMIILYLLVYSGEFMLWGLKAWSYVYTLIIRHSMNTCQNSFQCILDVWQYIFRCIWHCKFKILHAWMDSQFISFVNAMHVIYFYLQFLN